VSQNGDCRAAIAPATGEVAMDYQDYQIKKLFLKHLMNLAPNPEGRSDIGDQVDRELTALEGESLANARKTLKATFDDLLQMADHWSPEVKKRLDESLKSAGVMSLTSALASYSKRCEKFIQKKQLKTEDEYFLAKDYLEKNYQALDPEPRAKLERLVVEFEESRS
jgi:hypothetical protein